MNLIRNSRSCPSPIFPAKKIFDFVFFKLKVVYFLEFNQFFIVLNLFYGLFF